MIPAGGDGYKGALRRISLPGAVVTPAGDGVVAGQPATMRRAGGDGYKAALRRSSLPVVVGAPAGDGVVAGQPATMIPAGGDGCEAALRRIRPARRGWRPSR